MTEYPLTIEDYLGSQRAQRLIVAQVTAITDLLAKMPEAEDDTKDCDVDCVHETLVSVPIFDFLIETNHPPEFGGGKRIIYQLVSNKLDVDIMPSLCHDNTMGSFTNDLLRWSESGGVLDCLENGLGGCASLLYLSLTSLAWLYDGGSKKSPDTSFTSTNLQSPSRQDNGDNKRLIPQIYH